MRINPYQDGFKIGRQWYLDAKPITGDISEKMSRKYESPEERAKFSLGFMRGYNEEEQSDITTKEPIQ